MATNSFSGLIAAVPTPMRADGTLNLKPIQGLAEYYANEGVSGIYVASTAGECHSLTMDERQRLAAWWAEVIRGTSLRLLVHVGHQCLTEGRELAAHAAKVGAYAVTTTSPAFYKPSNAERLVACCQHVAGGARHLPFYFEDIPQWTGVRVTLTEFLGLGKKRIANLAGLIYSNPDLSQFQNCACLSDGAFEVVFGHDELALSGLVLGANAVAGPSLAFAAPIHRRLIQAYESHDMDTARVEQARICEVLETLGRYGLPAATKAVMPMIGIDCGPPRLPLSLLSPSQQNSLRFDLERLEFFDWVGPYHVHARRPTPKVDPGKSGAFASMG